MAALYSILVKLKAETDSIISPTQGHHAYALFLDLLGQSSANLAASLHRDEASKPFTISPLMGRFKRASNGISITKGADCSIRLTFLNDTIFAHFMDATYKLTDRPLRLESALFKLQQVCFSPRESPYCRMSSYEELFYDSKPELSVKLKFSSPTVFRSGGKRNVLLPEPSLVFTSYLRKWQHFSPLKFDNELTANFKNIETARHNLRTYILHFSGYQETGFEGDCAYNLPSDMDKNAVTMINTLANFAFYCATGAKTTMGMGQTRRVNVRNK